jgi:subtilisin family serine protease
MSWRVALIDSCGSWPGAIEAAAFASEAAAVAGEATRVDRRATLADPSGHGSRIAQLLTAGNTAIELLLGQVFLSAGPTSGAVVAAAIDWALARGANLIHMSLGLEADRAVLAAAVQRAIESGCIIVASMPARGALVYPAGYPGVIRATGDARCAPGELSCLTPWFFGGCPRFVASGSVNSPANSGAGTSAGASVGAAWVTRYILNGPVQPTAGALVAVLTAGACYLGAERRGLLPGG